MKLDEMRQKQEDMDKQRASDTVRAWQAKEATLVEKLEWMGFKADDGWIINPTQGEVIVTHPQLLPGAVIIEDLNFHGLVASSHSQVARPGAFPGRRVKDIQESDWQVLLEMMQETDETAADTSPNSQPSSPSLLSAREMKVLDLLADAWNAFMELTPEHTDHQTEFRMAIHRAQDVILSLPALRQVFSGERRERA